MRKLVDGKCVELAQYFLPVGDNQTGEEVIDLTQALQEVCDLAEAIQEVCEDHCRRHEERWRSSAGEAA